MSESRSALIVDDERDIRELLVLTLGRMGLRTDTAASLSEARALLAAHHYDLCLTDWNLPDGEGLRVVEHITQKALDVPVAVITAFGSPENAVAALKAGAFDYLAKPVALEQLRALVKQALKVPEKSGVLPPFPVSASEAALLCAVSSDGKLLAFPVKDLPELPRGKGNKIFGLSSKKVESREEYLAGIAVVAPEQSLIVRSGDRKMTIKFADLKEYRGERAQRGAVLPRGWRKVERLDVE